MIIKKNYDDKSKVLNINFLVESVRSDLNNKSLSTEEIKLSSSNWNNKNSYESVLSHRSGFHEKFLKLKNHLGVSPSPRKLQVDSFLKKCKSKCFKNINEAIKKCIKGKIRRLPQDFITNINIDVNKNLMSKTIYQIYQEYNVLPTIEAIYETNMVREEMKILFEQFVSLSFRDAFELYITSQHYLKDYERIKEKEDENFAILFDYVSRIFVHYYTFSKGNKLKAEKIIKLLKIGEKSNAAYK